MVWARRCLTGWSWGPLKIAKEGFAPSVEELDVPVGAEGVVATAAAAAAAAGQQRVVVVGKGVTPGAGWPCTTPLPMAVRWTTCGRR